ncbi:MAG: hypothetical protein LUE98_11130 [Tannerellaceae bacterium]|nr:hypothetical protein [Tannerellaceae bacterium]
MHNLKGLEIRGTAHTGIATHSLSGGHNSSDGYREIQTIQFIIFSGKHG